MKVGSLVKCVQAVYCTSSEYNAVVPLKGKIYTIRDIAVFTVATGVLLEEIKNEPFNFADRGWEEPYFNIKFFREIIPPISNIEQHIKEQTLEIKPA